MICRSESATSQLQKERIVKRRAKFTLVLFIDEGNFKHSCPDNISESRTRPLEIASSSS